jgi:hypothetical protein
MVVSERSLKCERGGTKISATLSALDQRVNAHVKRPKRREDAHALRKSAVGRTRPVASFAKQKQASCRISHEVLLECDASSHRFHSPGALGIDHLINNPRQRQRGRLPY